MADQNILILGNKHYENLNLDAIVDSFDIIYRFNLAYPGKNNGEKFGKLAMCCHVYQNLVLKPLNKEQIVEKYKDDYSAEFVAGWYDFFQQNKENFDEIFWQNEHNWPEWNKMLERYGSPHRFSKMASTGYSVIFRLLKDGFSKKSKTREQFRVMDCGYNRPISHNMNESSSSNKIYITGFTLCDKEIRQTIGEEDGFALSKNQGGGCHSFSQERDILAWLHNNNKIDASLCMLKDAEKPTIEQNKYDTKPSEFILDLLGKL